MKISKEKYNSQNKKLLTVRAVGDVKKIFGNQRDL